jgi:hypothetical protein
MKIGFIGFQNMGGGDLPLHSATESPGAAVLSILLPKTNVTGTDKSPDEAAVEFLFVIVARIAL